MRTWGIVEILEPNLEWVHNGVGIQLAIQFIHGEAISVLDGAIAKGKAEDPAELCCSDGNNGFRQYYRVKFAQACHGLELRLATHSRYLEVMVHARGLLVRRRSWPQAAGRPGGETEFGR